MKNNPILPTTNEFNDAFEVYKDSALCERLNEKFRVKPYHEENRSKFVFSKITSYVANMLSAVASSYLAFSFLNSRILFIGEIPALIISALLGLAVLFLIEKWKRILFSGFFKEAIQFKKVNFYIMAVSLVVLASSVTFSFYGGQQTIVDFTPPPEKVERDSAENVLSTQIAAIDKKVNKHENNVNKDGEIYWNSQKTISTLSQEKLALQNRLLAIQSDVDETNGTVLIRHESKVKLSAASFAWFTLAMEIVFVFCLWYMEIYDHRSHAEFAAVQTAEAAQFTPAPSQASFDEGTKVIEAAQSEPMPEQVESEQEAILVDTSATKRNMRNWYKRSIDSTDRLTRERNRNKYIQTKQAMEQAGIRIIEDSENKQIKFV